MFLNISLMFKRYLSKMHFNKFYAILEIIPLVIINLYMFGIFQTKYLNDKFDYCDSKQKLGKKIERVKMLILSDLKIFNLTRSIEISPFSQHFCYIFFPSNLFSDHFCFKN